MENISSGKLPLSLSIETDCGLALKIAEIGDTLPIKVAKAFSTSLSMPDVVGVRLYAGERPFVSDDILIAEMNIENVKGLFDDRPIISIVVSVDKMLNIDIEATDEGSLKTIKRHINRRWVPNEEETLRLIKEAQDNAFDDSVMQNRAKLIQMAKELVCRPEFEFKGLKAKMDFVQALKYKHRIRSFNARLCKLKPEDVTENIETNILERIKELRALSEK